MTYLFILFSITGMAIFFCLGALYMKSITHDVEKARDDLVKTLLEMVKENQVKNSVPDNQMGHGGGQ